MTAIGLAAVDRMRAQGMTDAQIKNAGFTFGEAAVASLGSGATPAPAGATSSSAIGQAQVDRMRAAGATDAQIRNSGFSFGEVAAQNLGVPAYNSTSSSSRSSGFNPYAYNNNGAGFGDEAVKRAKAAGWSDSDIVKGLADNNIKIGEKARGSLSFDPTAFNKGGAGFGAAALNRALSLGWSDISIMGGLSKANMLAGAEALKQFAPSIDAGSGTPHNWQQYTYKDGSVGFGAGPQITDGTYDWELERSRRNDSIKRIQSLSPSYNLTGFDPYEYNNGSFGGFGQAALEKARAAGYSDDVIEEGVRGAGIPLGMNVKFNSSSSPSSSQNSSSSSNFGFESISTNANEPSTAPNTPPVNTTTPNLLEEEKSTPWDFKYGRGSASKFDDGVFDSFEPMDGPPPIQKKKSVFEEVMNTTATPLSSPETFASVIANT